jgi:hypothetical protein
MSENRGITCVACDLPTVYSKRQEIVVDVQIGYIQGLITNSFVIKDQLYLNLDNSIKHPSGNSFVLFQGVHLSVC